MFRKCTGMICAMLLLLALFTLPAARTALAAEPSGSIERAVITHDNGVLKNAVSVDLKNVNFESSVQVQLYSGDTLLTTATLQGVNPDSYGFLTCCIATETADEYWPLTSWTPKDDVVPNKAVLVVDGHEQDTKTFTLNAGEWAALPGTVLPPSGSIERAVITHDNGVLKNAVSVDLKNVNFESSVQVQLYSGDTLLTTATLQGVNPGSYGFLTCCIATETADEYWPLTSWTPKDDVVPNKAVLVVDGHEQDTKTFTLDADEWAALPGTERPSSNEAHNMKAVAAKAPTCTKVGNSAYWVCEDCGLLLDADGKVLKAVPVIPATGHKYQDGVCTVCGASENAAVPETGDGANPLLWFALLLTAAGGALLCREVRRRFNG